MFKNCISFCRQSHRVIGLGTGACQHLLIPDQTWANNEPNLHLWISEAIINVSAVPVDLLGRYFEGDQALPPLLPAIGPHLTFRDLTDLRKELVIF